MEIIMKKTLITILILCTLTLTACGTSNVQATQPAANATPGSGNNFRNTPMPLAEELMIGTFKLEGTPNAVTAEEAAQLLPLWQVYKDLTSSTSAAQAEIDALAQQIQGTMTPAQVQAITAMKLTRADMSKTMQDMGIVQAGRPNASGTPQAGNRQGGGNDFGGGGPGGPEGGPGGGPGGPEGGPGGGQGFNNGQNISPEQMATFQARGSQNGGNGGRGFANRIPSALFDALIKLLESKK
jgi:hypothetical protein